MLTERRINSLRRINCLIKCYCFFTLYANNIYFRFNCLKVFENRLRHEMVTTHHVNFYATSTFTPIRQGVIVIHVEDVCRDIHGFQTGPFGIKISFMLLRPQGVD